MKLIRDGVVIPIMLSMLSSSAAAEPLSADQHPYEIIANVSEKAINLTRGTVDLAGKTVSKVGNAAAKPFARRAGVKGEPSGCQTAEADLQVLANERTSKADQLERGESFVTPSAQAARLVSSSYPPGKKVSAAQYIYSIDERVSEIHGACDVP